MDALTFLGAHVPLFAGIPEDQLTPLAQDATLKTLAAGQTALFAGMTVDNLHIVASGTAVVSAKVPGKGVVKVAELGPGQVFGELSMLEGSIASATVKAGEKGLIVLLVPEAPFRRLATENETLVGRIRELISARRSPPTSPASSAA